MSIGLVALLDDVATIARMAATSLDDVAGLTAKAGAKSAGLVIDDAAVTPRYVVGLSPARELPMIWRITVGSLRNKLIILLPLALLLSLFAPWLITPLLMIGGAYLSYEGAEKVYEALFPHAAHHHEEKIGAVPTDPVKLEDRKVAGAIGTDFILSAEIMAIALSTVPDAEVWMQGLVLAAVGVGITVLVYGGVGLIVKADDVGVALAKNTSRSLFGATVRGIGRALVIGMPVFLKVLSIVGTAAMIWVGGGIIVHGLAEFGFAEPEHWIGEVAHMAAAAAPEAGGLVDFLVHALGTGIVGLILGFLLIPIVEFVLSPALHFLRVRARYLVRLVRRAGQS
jgi:uncharacterized protein